MDRRRLAAVCAGLALACAVASAAITVEDCDIRDSSADPLLYFSGCEQVEILDSVFLRNSGSAFISIEGDGDQIGIVGCEITGNAIASFAGGGPAPVLRNITWSANTFADGTGMGQSAQSEDDWAFHHHEVSGLGFQYPGNWRLEESRDGFLGVTEPREAAGVVFARLYHIEETDNLEGDTAGVMARAFAVFSSQSQQEGAQLHVQVAEPAVSPEQGLPSQLFRGAARLGGEERRFVLRLIAARGEVYAALAVYQSPDAEEIHGAEVEQVLASFGPVGGDE